MIYEPHSYLDDGWWLDGGGGWNGPGLVGLGRLPLDGGSPFTPMACSCPMPDALSNQICGCTGAVQVTAGGSSTPAAPTTAEPGNGVEVPNGDFVISKETLLIAAAIVALLVVVK